jgi:hypothetical protein
MVSAKARAGTRRQAVVRLPRGVITPFRSRLDGVMLRREAWVCRKESERAVHRFCLDGWRSGVPVVMAAVLCGALHSCLNLRDAAHRRWKPARTRRLASTLLAINRL